MKKIVYLLMLSGLAACSSGSNENTGADVITFNDFESSAGWGSIDDSALNKDLAHSGRYSIKVDPAREFSFTFETVLGKVSSTKIKRIRLEGWIYAPSAKATAELGLQVTDPDQGNKQVYGDGIKISDAVKDYGKWVKVSKDITLPDNIAATHHLKLFLWRASSPEAVYADDLRISILE